MRLMTETRSDRVELEQPGKSYCTTPSSSACAMHHGGAVLDTVFGPLWARLEGKSQQGWGESGCTEIRFEISCDAGILLRVAVSVVAAAGPIDEVKEDAEGETSVGMVGEVEQMLFARGPLGRDIALTMESYAEDDQIHSWIIGPDPDRSDMAIYLRRKMLRYLVGEWARELGAFWVCHREYLRGGRRQDLVNQMNVGGISKHDY
jgi:hypothetical protein